MGKENDDVKRIDISLILIILSAFILIAVVSGFYLNTFGTQVLKDRGAWGLFGDYMGGSLNPLLSFFTLLILVYGMRLQKKELIEARLGISASNDALNRQCTIQQNQAYEQTLFRLIDDFRNDNYTRLCFDNGRKILTTLYSLRQQEGVESQEFREILRRKNLGGVFSNVYVEKLNIIIEAASRLEEPDVYLKIIQVTAGPTLMSAVVQYNYMFNRSAYDKIKLFPNILKGISMTSIFIDEVAEDFLGENINPYYLKKHESTAVFEKYVNQNEDDDGK